MQSKAAILDPPFIQPPGVTAYPTMPLTGREQQVLHGMWDGLSAEKIAERLTITRNTVLEHKRRIFVKFNANCATQVLRRAVQAKLLH